MSVKRVAVIFDNSLRPETTGLYCRRALGSLVEVEHFLPQEVGPLIERQGHLGAEFDLYLQIDDGHRDRLPASLAPAAYWAIDTHMDLAWAVEKSADFDFVFAAQRDGAEQLRQAGIATARWLPLACDPEFHCRLPELPPGGIDLSSGVADDDVEKRFDVCFVGNIYPGPRSQLLNVIQQRFPNHCVTRAYLLDMSAVYTASKIVFNRSVKTDVNMRVFEALACGSLLMTNDLAENGLRELFQDGVHLATYACTDELIDKTAFYLEHGEARERIAARGRREVHARHTYLHRMSELLRTVERGLSRRVVGMPAAVPRSVSAAAESAATGQVSVCLLSWKRPENVRRIVEQLRREPLIDDILVWNNDPQQQLSFAIEGVRVIDSDANVVTYGRYLCARQARHNVIYTQDDDCLVHNIAELYESFCLDPEALTHNLKLGHLARNAENVFGSAQMGLLGWGAFFNREWIAVFDRYRDEYGEDELLLRKADRLFTLLRGRRHRALPAEVTDLDGASGIEALSVMNDHVPLTQAAVSRAVSLLSNLPQAADESAPDRVEGSTELSSQRPGFAAPSRTEEKDDWYFGFSRPEVVALVPLSARRVLDIGCGAGRLGAALKQRQAVEVIGIELNPAAAAAAGHVLDEVRAVDIEDEGVEFPDGQFDCVICADVLEHLRQPARVLRKIRRWLHADGTVVASLPNVRHYSVVQSLLSGNWTYESAGLLDEDHVRFFTRRELEKLFFRAGFAIAERQAVPGLGYRDWEERGRPGEVQLDRWQIGNLTPEDAEEFYTYQFLIAARRSPAALPPATHGNGRPRRQGDLQLDVLRQLASWPPERPHVTIPTRETGWMEDGAQAVLGAALSRETKLVVELGAWLGTSTRFIADRAPNATVISVDHWEGSPEHHSRPEWRELLPTLYETFLAMCWDYRRRIVPLRMTTGDGLQRIADCGLQPDVVYFDAEHSYEPVRADLEFCARRFPQAILVGDDYEAPGVGQAVQELANLRHLPVRTHGTRWKGWLIDPHAERRAGPPPQGDWGLSSIIIVTHNQLGYTKSCVDSLRLVTDEPYELIVVDNGSTDGTTSY